MKNHLGMSMVRYKSLVCFVAFILMFFGLLILVLRQIRLLQTKR